VRGLGAERLLVEVIAEDTKGEDRYSQAIAAIEGVTTCKLGEDLVVVFWKVLELLIR
jgi:hypothetical protein